MKKKITSCLLFGLLSYSWIAHATQNVYFVGDNSQGVSLSSAFNLFQLNEDSESGCAILVNLGDYPEASSNMNIAYFTEVMGIGNQRDDTKINSVTVTSPAQGADTRTFWRSLENLTIKEKQTWNVSQGTALRRIHVLGDLDLFNPEVENAYVSGGFMADSTIDGTVDSGRQQQWFSRNATFNDWKSSEGGDNGVFVNSTDDKFDTNAAPFHGHYESLDISELGGDDNPNSVQGVTQKPYLVCQSDTGCYNFDDMTIRVPTTDVSQHMEGDISDTSYDQYTDDINSDNFCVISPDTSSHSESTAVQACISDTNKKGMILTPGLFHFHATIPKGKDNFVVLGIGYPHITTDVPKTTSGDYQGTPALTILGDNTIQSKFLGGCFIPEHSIACLYGLK